ncbi:outer membrane protein assembly factor BamC [Noviherbaspirillum cavernae]|uniref:Outer membrane protein assembly factor BamC n=2 Tax=Noviherbaspirillum cavernae TaxID=2320862 RepID=A0A418X6C3_9BURK|nr:outer membrane protein assembly factor BamC [Noviherbaspirillum cavernae]
MLEPDRVDYKSAGKAPTLEVPPDLTQLQRENRYAIPEANRGTATASGYGLQQNVRPTSTAVVAPKATADMHMERSGNQRWLVVKQAPETLWPQIKDFWQDSGFLINFESPQSGLMETDWAENRAKIPQDFIRNTIGKALDSLYSTGERDKFRTRLERAADGSTEIYISHRGAQEVLVGQQKEGTVWTPRPADPELEAEFLSRLMARLGVEDTRAKTAAASVVSQPTRAKVVKGSNGGYVEVDESFDRAWRRVGLALDRVGFTVEDRDRTQGLYFVRYVDQGRDAQNKAATDKGFFSKLFSFGSGSDKAISAQRYQVAVKGAGAVSQVAVLNNEGRPESSSTADKILSLLNDQLK